MNSNQTYPCPCCPSGQRKRIYSRRASRWFWKCEQCKRAFSDFDGQPAEAPLRGDPDPSISCPLCKAPMCRVSGAANGDFFSCSRHPRCRGTLELSDVDSQ